MLRRAAVLIAVLFVLGVKSVEAQCLYSVAPTSVSVQSTGQSGSIAVTTGGLCSWTATSGVPWITITGGASMTGLGSVSYSVAATTVARVGMLTVAGQTVTVTQGAGQGSTPPASPGNLRIITVGGFD